MIKFGQVKAYNPATKEAVIEYVRPDACAKCGGCGSLNKSGSITLTGECEVGNWVKVVMPDGKFMFSTALAYGLPLVGFLAGFLGGYYLGNGNDLITVITSAAGIALALLGLRIAEKKISGKPQWTPHIEEVYDHKPQTDDIGCGGLA